MLAACVLTSSTYAIAAAPPPRPPSAASQPAVPTLEVAKSRCRDDVAWLVDEQKLGFDFDHALGRAMDEDFAAWRIAAEANDAKGLCLYGLAHRYGIGVKQDAARGKELIARAAESGDAEAMAVYSRLLRLGNRDEEPDADAANEWLSKALSASSALAADALPVEGARELIGDDDVPAALKAYEQYAAEGNLNAKVELAFTLRLGWLIAPDINRSVKLLTEAAEAGHIVAMMELAEMYAQGRYVTPDIRIARKWYKAASDTGDARAVFVAARAYAGRTLGVPEPQVAALLVDRLKKTPGPTAAFALFMVERDLPPPKDDPAGVRLVTDRLMPAALGGETEAYVWLAKLHREGKPGVPADPQRSKRYLEWGMATNNASSINDLACAYRYGWYAPAEEEKAGPLFFRAARQGCAPAMTSVAMRLRAGRGVPRDVAASDEAYLSAALAGDPDAMHQMAQLALEGFRKHRPDPAGAEMWARMALDAGRADAAFVLYRIDRERGDPMTPLTNTQLQLLETGARSGGSECEYELGRRYLHGLGVTADRVRGMSMFEDAAERDVRGDVLISLGIEWASGKSMPPNPAKALECYQRSADRGNGTGWARVGYCRQTGAGVAKDGKEAIRCYEKGIRLGSEEATAALADMLLRGESIDKDVNRAVAMFIDAADRGSGPAALRLTELHFIGYDSFPRNFDEGSKWAAKAVDLRQPMAAYTAAICYRDIGDYQNERKWLDLGEAHGLPDCTNGIGVQYRFGHGVPQDLKVAFKYYQRAADGGCRIAISNLAWCYETGNGVEKDLGEAFRLQLRAAVAGEPEAMFHVGRMYLDGTGVRRDQDAGLTWLVKAADAGYDKAKVLVDAARARGLVR